MITSKMFGMYATLHLLVMLLANSEADYQSYTAAAVRPQASPLVLHNTVPCCTLTNFPYRPSYRPPYRRPGRRRPNYRPVLRRPGILQRVRGLITSKINVVKNLLHTYVKRLGGAVVGIAEAKALVLRAVYDSVYANDDLKDIPDGELAEIYNNYVAGDSDTSYDNFSPVQLITTNKPSPVQPTYTNPSTNFGSNQGGQRGCSTCFLIYPRPVSHPSVNHAHSHSQLHSHNHGSHTSYGGGVLQDGSEFPTTSYKTTFTDGYSTTSGNSNSGSYIRYTQSPTSEADSNIQDTSYVSGSYILPDGQSSNSQVDVDTYFAPYYKTGTTALKIDDNSHGSRVDIPFTRTIVSAGQSGFEGFHSGISSSDTASAAAIDNNCSGSRSGILYCLSAKQTVAANPTQVGATSRSFPDSSAAGNVYDDFGGSYSENYSGDLQGHSSYQLPPEFIRHA